VLGRIGRARRATPVSRAKGLWGRGRPGRKILGTGGSGFIGCFILRRLIDGGDESINFDAREPGPEAGWWLAPVADHLPLVRGPIAD
jgi:nucleoside-diphosphate-sugar epimerase